MTRRQTTVSAACVLVASLVLSACGIPTSQPSVDSDAISSAAAATASLPTYDFAWTADYDLVDPAKSSLSVNGSGTIDSDAESADSRISYDEALRNDFERLFPGHPDEPIASLTRIVGDEVYASGMNVALMPGVTNAEPDVWYRVTNRRGDVGDAFVRSEVRPADVLEELVAPLVEAGSDRVVVDRDVILDLGSRFSGSLFDFGLRIGGGDFIIEIAREDGYLTKALIEGDDPEAGVSRFAFEIEFIPRDDVEIRPPQDPLPLP